LELIPYYGYGEFNPHGHGKFFSFVSGMGYLADIELLDYLMHEIPADIGNEDVALSILTGKENIHLLDTTTVYYNITKNLLQFVQIRGRHIRELYRIYRWLMQWKEDRVNNDIQYACLNKKQKKCFVKDWVRCKFYAISENRMLPFVSGFFQSTQKFKISKDAFIVWFKNIPAVKLGSFFIFILFPLGVIIYLLINIIFYFQSFIYNQEGWETKRN